ncbi:MAG: NosD domain-containing protein [bacterium]
MRNHDQSTAGRNRVWVGLLAAVAILAGCQGAGTPLSSPDSGRIESLAGAPQSEHDFLKTLGAGESARETRGVATPISAPTVITTPGEYLVANDFSVSAETGDGIVIQADDVMLDLGGHVISGPGNKLGRAIVVDGANRARVSNGTVATFGIGVALQSAEHCIVRGINIEGGDETAAPPANPPQIGFLLVNSSRNFVGRNTCTLVNLGIFVRGGGSSGNRIAHNLVVGGDNGLLAICYNPAMGEGPAGPSGDLVIENKLSRFGKGIQTSEGSSYNGFNANVIEYFALAWEDFNGTNQFLNNITTQIMP